jgi:hypothetical protein
MKKYIVITTIHPKSPGIAKFEQMEDWQIVLVGDKKSVPIEPSENLTFLSAEDQNKLGYGLAKVCPYNHYTRKNIGYLYAIQQGADVIYETDDDNIPYDHWGLPEFACDRQSASQQRFVNVYKYFTDALIWPRGYPLDEIQQPASEEIVETDRLAIGVWQGLTDLDPDVDAVHRLVFNKQVTFEGKPPFALGKGSYCPFNSQNTFWHIKAFPYLYLPATTSFRFTDVLRGYVAQQLMWSRGLHLGFTGATVYQERNPHNLMRDFADEVECYLNVKNIVNVLASLELNSDPLTNLEVAYQTLAEQEFVEAEEVALCQAWIKDVRAITGEQIVKGDSCG